MSLGYKSPQRQYNKSLQGYEDRLAFRISSLIFPAQFFQLDFQKLWANCYD